MVVFLVDPMSYNNLGLYDYELLKNMGSTLPTFYGNEKFQYDYSNFKPIYNYSNKKGLSKVSSYFFSQVKLFKEIVKKKPKIIHFQWFRLPILDYYLLKLIKRKNINIIITAHNILPHNSGNKYLNIYNKIYHIVDTIIVHDDNTKNSIVSQFQIDESRIKVVPHGLLEFNKNFELLEEVSMVRQSNNNIIITFIGGISEYKNINEVVQSWLNYIKMNKNKNLSLVIAGKGKIPNKDKLKSLDNTVIVNEFLTDQKFHSYIEISDVILLPYKNISQSGVLLTALAARKRVVVTDVGGLSEPFKFGEIGWIIDKNNVRTDLEDFFNTINNKPELINEQIVSEEVWSNIQDYYSWKRISSLTESLYNNLLYK